MITLSPVPKQYPECCLSISEALFACITRCLREITESAVQKTTILSIGCGTGFLEAQLATYLRGHGYHGTQIAGVEVASADVKYLPSELVFHVPGTRSICHGAANAAVLLFIYPRDSALIRQYLTRFDSNVRMVLWLGPRADWVLQEPVLRDIPAFSEPWQLGDASLAEYEIAFVFRNRGRPKIEPDVQNTWNEERLNMDIDSI